MRPEKNRPGYEKKYPGRSYFLFFSAYFLHFSQLHCPCSQLHGAQLQSDPAYAAVAPKTLKAINNAMNNVFMINLLLV